MYSISYIYLSQSAVVQLYAIRTVAPPSNFELRVCIKDIHCMRTIWSEFGAQKNPLPEGKGLICRGRLVLDGSPGNDLPSQLVHVAVEFIKVHRNVRQCVQAVLDFLGHSVFLALNPEVNQHDVDLIVCLLIGDEPLPFL